MTQAVAILSDGETDSRWEVPIGWRFTVGAYSIYPSIIKIILGSTHILLGTIDQKE